MPVGNGGAAPAFTALPPVVVPARASPGRDDIANNRALRAAHPACDSPHLMERCFGCRMNLRVRETPWRLMLAVNVAVLIGVLLHKITREPYVPYIHLLVDYHFGFTKRALIGALVSLFFRVAAAWM